MLYPENVTVMALMTLRQLRRQRRVAIRKYASNMRGGYESLAAAHANAAIHLKAVHWDDAKDVPDDVRCRRRACAARFAQAEHSVPDTRSNT
jgi:hypothetical protein